MPHDPRLTAHFSPRLRDGRRLDNLGLCLKRELDPGKRQSPRERQVEWGRRTPGELLDTIDARKKEIAELAAVLRCR